MLFVYTARKWHFMECLLQCHQAFSCVYQLQAAADTTLRFGSTGVSLLASIRSLASAQLNNNMIIIVRQPKGWMKLSLHAPRRHDNTLSISNLYNDYDMGKC